MNEICCLISVGLKRQKQGLPGARLATRRHNNAHETKDNKMEWSNKVASNVDLLLLFSLKHCRCAPKAAKLCSSVKVVVSLNRRLLRAWRWLHTHCCSWRCCWLPSHKQSADKCKLSIASERCMCLCRMAPMAVWHCPGTASTHSQWC